MINQMSLRNFKSLKEVQVDLERFTMFVGPNASGKSSFLQALHLVSSAFRSDDESYRRARRSDVMGGSNVHLDPHTALINSFTRKSDGPVELCVRQDDSIYLYIAETKKSDSTKLHVYEAAEGKGQLAFDDTSKIWGSWRPNRSFIPPFEAVLLRLESSKLLDTEPSRFNPTTMDPDGTGMHSALANIALSNPDGWLSLQDHLREVVPTVRRLRHNMKGINGTPALLFDMQGADSLTAEEVSEGTLLVLGLLTALYAENRPNLVLLDDLDRGLHPKAQRQLINLLRRLLEITPDLQIVATTHSPYLLGTMQPEEVRMTHLDAEGYTVCAPLVQHPEFETWKEEMNPGEMWSLFGEQWVVEQDKESHS